MAIARRDTASVCTFDTSIRQHLAPAAGWPQLARLVSLLETAEATGGSRLDDALLAFGAAVRGPGLVIVLSDFLGPGQGTGGFAYLQHQGLTPAAVQIMAPEEIEPELMEATELIDVEHPGATPLVVDAAMIGDYRRRLDEHCGAMRGMCLSQQIPWTRVTSTMTFREQIGQLEQAGLMAVHG